MVSPYRQIQFVCLLAAFVAAIPLFIPVDFHLLNTRLGTSLLNQYVEFSFVGSITVGLIRLFEMSTEIITPVPFVFDTLFPRLCMIMALVLPGFYFGNPLNYYIITSVQRLLWKGSTYLIICNQSTLEAVNSPQYMIMMALFVFIEAIDLYGLAVYNHEARVAAVVLKYSLYIFPMVRSSIVYQRLHIRYYKTFVSMPIHKWIFQPLYGSAGGLFFVEEYTPSYIICYGIMMVISTLFISAVPNHLSSFRRYLVDSELDGKRTLVRYVSHEIRTPLNSIILGLQIVEGYLKEQGQYDAHVSDVLLGARESGNLAVRILDDLLDYEKLGAGSMTLDQALIGPYKFLTEAIASFTIPATVKNIAIVSTFSEVELCDWMLFVDEGKIRKVISNFLSNAIKFSPVDSKITIDALVIGTSTESFIRIEVTDLGPGMSPEQYQRLFNEVVQFNPNTLQHGGGSGIGLWISKKIVDLHGGVLRVKSEVGAGTTFTLELGLHLRAEEITRRYTNRGRMNNGTVVPLNISNSKIPETRPKSDFSAVSLVDDVQSVKARGSIESNCDASPFESGKLGVMKGNSPIFTSVKLLRKLRVLIVDDSSTNRKMMTLFLNSKKKYECFDVCDGEKAVKKYLSDRLLGMEYDLILMDNYMPVLDGKEATKSLRQLGYQGVIIGVTGDALSSDLDEFIACGLDAVLTKPIDADKFEEIVRLHVMFS